MDLKAFCNTCLKEDETALLVTSCRHVICSGCYAKFKGRCGLCKSPCKVIPFTQLPEEMRVYFKPVLPMLKKYLKIAKFQLEQRSIWTHKRKSSLKRMIRKRQSTDERKQRLMEMRNGYRGALEQNTGLKKQLK